MIDGYKIRSATSMDAGTIAQHRRAMFADMGKRDVSRLDQMAAATRPWIERKITAGEYQGWLAVGPDGSIVAGLGLWLIEWQPTIADLSGRRGMILNVYTELAHRRLGIARLLMKSALDWCRENRINVVILHASDEGRPLYAALGFKPTTEMRLILMGDQ